MKYPFIKPYLTGNEITQIQEVLKTNHLQGEGPFTHRSQELIKTLTQTKLALLTNSCTSALEMSALLANLQPGDEVIMPSFTFVSTANAFVLRGAVPVFVDIRPDTLNIDERLIEGALTQKTKAIVPVHYAGVGCEMEPILELAKQHNLLVIEDAAQGFDATWKGRPLGSIGNLAALSFHGTKNIISGEGGALLVNDSQFVERSEILREKGTNRKKFLEGLADKYTWVDVGSSFLCSDITAAFLLAQLQAAKEINQKRIAVWDQYYKALESAERQGLLIRPTIPEGAKHNGHIFYVLLSRSDIRPKVISALKEVGIGATFHYVPLHSAPAGLKFGRTPAEMNHTDSLSSRILRLPLWPDLDGVAYITEQLVKTLVQLRQ
jgi:dTDP-4-amino-4,6-dideoxygalactose transaminase